MLFTTALLKIGLDAKEMTSNQKVGWHELVLEILSMSFLPILLKALYLNRHPLVTWYSLHLYEYQYNLLFIFSYKLPEDSKYRSGTVNSKSFVGKVLL